MPSSFTLASCYSHKLVNLFLGRWRQCKDFDTKEYRGYWYSIGLYVSNVIRLRTFPIIHLNCINMTLSRSAY